MMKETRLYHMNTFDYIIVGGGASGCVLANRLSEQSHHNILLIEAGDDIYPGKEPADILSIYPMSYFNPNYKWQNIRGYWKTPSTSQPSFIEQGKVLGGSSSIMGMVALRGVPDDFNEWENYGLNNWGWDDVLPYFNKSEHDLDFKNEFHGNNGPTNIFRNKMADWPPLAKAGLHFSNTNGIPYIADANGDFRDGYCSVPIAASHTQRSSTAVCYLNSSVRKRKNLTVLCNTSVLELIFEDKKVTGVKALKDNNTLEFFAHETILTLGALQSPTLLLKSGIGPSTVVEAAGIEVRHHLPGVGQNLQNHPAVYICGLLFPNSRQKIKGQSHNNTAFRFSSNHDGCDQSDMYITIQSKSAWHSLGQQVANFSTALHKPKSRGSIELSKDGNRNPIISFNFLNDPRDLERMSIGLQKCLGIIFSKDIFPHLRHVFPVNRNAFIRQLNQKNKRNYLITSFFANLLDLAPFATKIICSRLSADKVDFQKLVEDSALLKEFALKNVGGLAHNVGTCRMGVQTDQNAVVDEAGKVFGIQGLRIADASIMPTVPSGNTFLSTIMLAEKIADAIKSND